MEEELCPSAWMEQEESVIEKTDEAGCMWRKVYFGGGAHFENWLEQFNEIYGAANVEIEEVNTPGGPACYERSGQKMVRIWAKVS